MKPTTKPYAILFLIVFLMVACGPVMPVGMPFKTLTPATPLPTPKPDLPKLTPTVTATFTSTPQPNSEDYQLQPWIANDEYYSKLAEKFSQDFYVDFNIDEQAYDLVFQAEKIIRDQSSDWRQIAWRIVARNPKGIPLPGMRSGQDLLAFLMEDLLNNEKVKPEELPTIVKNKRKIPWECSRAEIGESPAQQGSYLIVNNLFGDKRDAGIFLTGNCEGTAVYVLRNISGQYRVEKLRDWQALEIPFAGYNLSLSKVEDVNGNGLPEVVFDVFYAASGTPGYSGRNLELYEWDTSRNGFVSDHTETFEDECFYFESCENMWHVEATTARGVKPIIVEEWQVTMYDDFGESSVCDPLIVEHTYLWRDGKFAEQKTKLLPPTDEEVECQLSWSMQALNRGIDGIVPASGLISKALGDWPNSMNDIWGPASQDYFALRLGLAYDVTGHEDAALALIQGVTEYPSSPEFDFIPQLASTYLDVRSRQGRIQACQEINLLQRESAYKLDDNFFFLPLDKFRETWGVGAPIWRNRVDDLCNDIDVLELLVKKTHGSKYENIDEFLIRLDWEPGNVQPIYESDALTVWLLSLPVQSLDLANHESGKLERIDQQRIWLLTRTLGGFDVAYVDDISKNANLSMDYLELGPSGLLVALEPDDTYTKRLFLFHVALSGVVRSELYDFYVDGIINHQAKEIVTITNSYWETQPEIAAYHWDPKLASLDKKIINFDFSNAQNDAERILFQEHDFTQAILYINTFLVQAPQEPKELLSCYQNDCTYYPDWYHPYMRYLLALAYELSGRVDQARDIYFALNQDYPSNIFGLAAEHRLAPAKP